MGEVPTSKVDIPAAGSKCNDRVKEVSSFTPYLTSVRPYASFFALKIPTYIRLLFKFLCVPILHTQVEQQLLNSTLVAHGHESWEINLYYSISPKSL